ncbi:MAG: CheR family methyltransferase, partial [Thermodesulfobacteriota bacterium]
NGSSEELVHMINAISTNKTSFFREKAQFDLLRRTIIPELIQKKTKKRDRKIRIWSAGCSTGEEPYSLAIILCDVIKDIDAWDVKILATDISTKALDIARAGVYKKKDIEGIPPLMFNACFQLGVGEKKGLFRVKRHLMDMVVVRRLNLMLSKYPFRGLFDLISCRNVMIYFNKATQQEIITKFFRYLQPGGYLFLGHAESLTGVRNRFVYIQPSVYQKVKI